MSIPVLTSRIPAADMRRVAPAPKVARSIYSTPEFRRWREAVIARAGRRCEAVDDGQRCGKAEPRHRMFADHEVEVRDGGALHDVANGQCLCGAHHGAKQRFDRQLRAERAPASIVDVIGRALEGAAPDAVLLLAPWTADNLKREAGLDALPDEWLGHAVVVVEHWRYGWIVQERRDETS